MAAQLLLLVPALGSFLFTFGTVVELIRFASLRAVLPGGARPEAAPSPEWGAALRDPRVLWPLAVDLGLVTLFVLQHSLMATALAKRWTAACFGVLQRSFYVFCSSLALQLLMRYWQPVRDGPLLWNACTEPWDTWVSLACFILHFIAWMVIFSVILIFDYAELMGVKQVYYHCLGMGDPLALKSVRAVRLYSHLRHPVYLEFLLVLWVVPCLSLDRLLLASLFTAYLSCGHALDQQDYLYLRAQLEKKFLVFSREEAAYGDLLARNGPTQGKQS
ncbi:nurim [Carettochelys insculpta]|uniref:nurim n=1 Tax=Carettochelys insculpta TaxID=44489 RepID=UPI003EBFF872